MPDFKITQVVNGVEYFYYTTATDIDALHTTLEGVVNTVKVKDAETTGTDVLLGIDIIRASKIAEVPIIT